MNSFDTSSSSVWLQEMHMWNSKSVSWIFSSYIWAGESIVHPYQGAKGVTIFSSHSFLWVEKLNQSPLHIQPEILISSFRHIDSIELSTWKLNEVENGHH